MERRDLDCAETLIIHVGTNDLGTTRNLDFIMGEVYSLVVAAKKVTEMQTGPEWSSEAQRRVMAAYKGPK